MAQRDEKGRFVRTKPDYKAMYEVECIKRAHFEDELFLVKAERDRFMGYCHEKDFRIEFLLDHAGPILRWMYKLKFKKGE